MNGGSSSVKGDSRSRSGGVRVFVPSKDYSGAPGNLRNPHMGGLSHPWSELWTIQISGD